MGQAANAFLWQLITRVGEESFARGLFPTDEEKLSRSENPRGAMLVAGNLALVGSTFDRAGRIARVEAPRGPRVGVGLDSTSARTMI
jgi:hypothetical protein